MTTTPRPNFVDALIEIPKGSRNKYEIDAATGRLRLDRVLHSPLHYPTDYGFLVDTLGEDGDHLDVLMLTYEASFPGCLVAVRPVGMLDMRDDKGRDQKVLAVSLGEPRLSDVTELSHVSRHFLMEIEHFFQVYKTLEQKETEIYGWREAEVAWRTLEEAQVRFKQHPH